MAEIKYEDIDLFYYHSIDFDFSRFNSILDNGIVSKNKAKELGLKYYYRNYTHSSTRDDHISVNTFARTVLRYCQIENELYDYNTNKICFVIDGYINTCDKVSCNNRDEYTKEEQLNYKWNDIIARNPKKSNITAKMNSDNKLQGYKDKIIKATEGLKAHPEAIIAGALVIKHHSIITIVESGFGDEYRELNPNHFLYYAIFERYKPYFTYCNIGGISSFEENARFKGLNDYRLKWKPQVFEFIGEFDLVCSEYTFKKLIKTNYIENEFSKVPLAQREEKK